MDKEINIKSFDFQYYQELRNFISAYWREDHPVVKSDALFRWQYYGYGQLRGYENFQLLFDADKLIGFRAVIPLEIQISHNKDTKVETCMGSAMWMVSPDYRGMGLGYKIHHNTENASDASLAIGANWKTSVPLYLRSGYHEIKRFNRYIMPLSYDYTFLLKCQCDASCLDGWIPSFEGLPLVVENDDVRELAEVWKASTMGVEMIALHRSEEYWKWRYIDSPIFKYHIFGGKEAGGIVVARIEKAIGVEKDGIKVMRIIEAIPYSSNIWKYERDETFELLLKFVVNWGQNEGCAVADFHCTTNKLYPSFRNIGFVEQPLNFEPAILSLSDFFQPVEKSVHHFNGYLRLADKHANESFNYENTYFVRSDTDQDRVNII